ncbi:MAG: hypothetical protein GY765_38090, partial [bacterium]|nr:hypothetical protein [bacterium]
QQLTYVGLLNILFPFQMLTGIFMMGAERLPDFAEKLGGMSVLGPLHSFGSWLFISFLLAHVYLTTTGHTVFSNIRAMVGGYDEVSADQPDEEVHTMVNMEMLDMIGTLIKKATKK